jgi:hypothetical protein
MYKTNPAKDKEEREKIELLRNRQYRSKPWQYSQRYINGWWQKVKDFYTHGRKD